MKKPDQDILLLQQLMDKYRFTRPVSVEARDEILSSKRKNLVRVLKTVGAYSAAHGALLIIYFAFKKLGAVIPMMKFIVPGVAVTAISIGGYYAATTMTPGSVSKAPAIERQEPRENIRKKYKWVDRITLYNGSIIEGAIMSRGERYRVLTAGGITYIPRNKIKMVKPLKIEIDAETDRPEPADPVTR